jgi:hypothetical protein
VQPAACGGLTRDFSAAQAMAFDLDQTAASAAWQGLHASDVKRIGAAEYVTGDHDAHVVPKVRRAR